MKFGVTALVRRPDRPRGGLRRNRAPRAGKLRQRLIIPISNQIDRKSGFRMSCILPYKPQPPLKYSFRETELGVVQFQGERQSCDGGRCRHTMKLNHARIRIPLCSLTGAVCSRSDSRWQCAACVSHRRSPPASSVPFRRRGMRNTAWRPARLRL